MKPPVITFRAKVTLLLFGIILLLGVMAVFQGRNDMRRYLGTELERRGLAIAEDLAANSTDYLLTDDLFGLYELVNRTKLNNPDVRYILIVTPSGRVKVNTFGEGIPRGLLEANTVAPGQRHQLRRIQTEEALIRDIAVPILEGKAGTVRVGMSDRSIEEAVRRNGRSLGLLVALAAALGLVTSYWLAYYLTRPLRQLLDAVHSVTRGNLSQRVPCPQRDEVGQIGRAFNVMTEALAEKENARQALMEKVIASQEDERKRVARELHDELAQQLTSILLTLEAAEGTVQHNSGSKQAI
jgi:HAMP domain-containing protein